MSGLLLWLGGLLIGFAVGKVVGGRRRTNEWYRSQAAAYLFGSQCPGRPMGGHESDGASSFDLPRGCWGRCRYCQWWQSANGFLWFPPPADAAVREAGGQKTS